MIPKIILQTSIYKPPEYIIKSIENILPDYKYYHYNDEEIIEFFEENKIDELPDSIEVFNSLKNGAHKSDFFRYYFLYINGGIYIDSDAMILESIKDLDIFNENDFFTVNSILKNDSIFNGFIGCSKEHSIIYNALHHIYYMNKDELDKDYFIITKKLKQIIDKSDEKILLLEELKQNNIEDNIFIQTYYNEIPILKHYYNKNYIVESSIPICKIKNSIKKIGITLNIPNTFGNIFSNGINQNAIYLGELLIKIGYEVYFIINNIDEKKNENIIKELLYLENFKFIKQNKIYTINFDVVFFVSFNFGININKTLRYMETKCIYYNCGNVYLIEAEKMLYNKNNSVNNYNKDMINMYDEIWVIPQMINTNLHYLQTLYRTKTIGVPFIWSPKAIEFSAKTGNISNINELLYKKNKNKKIAVFEPNLSIMKWCVPALLICENAYRIENNIEHVFLNNTKDHKNLQMTEVQKIINSLDLFTDNKITSEQRYNTLIFMKEHASYAVSFQMENNLNYLYFDLAWMGYPIIHNANLIKNIGYYYDKFNYSEGGKLLNNVINNHDLNLESYIIENRKIINNYIPDNKILQNKYKILIENLFD